MFTTTRKIARAEVTRPYADDEILGLSPQSLPESYSLAELYDELVKGDGKQDTVDDLQNLLILHSCLQESTRLQHQANDAEYITKLSLWISKSILPTANIVTHDDAPEDGTNASRQKALQAARQKGNLGLQGLLKLLTLPEAELLTSIPTQTLLSILTFTSPRDIWSTPTSLTTTSELLAIPSIQSALQAPDFISTEILQRFIRPLFSASKPSTITAAGRKAMPSSAPRKQFDFNEERKIRPWLYETVYAVTVLEWAVGAISPNTLQQSWRLILPPLLTLLDTPGTSILTRGLALTTTLLPKLPPATLSQTGLASVFSDAIIPVILYLPSITPLEESLEILPLAYDALFALYDVQFPPAALPSSSTTSVKISPKPPCPASDQQNEKARLQFLDLLLRQSIFPAFLHASAHAPIVSLLITQLCTLVPKLGVHSIKHLKDILPILASVLSDPFAGARLDDVLGALEMLRVLVLVCWARLSEKIWRREVVRMAVLCWGVLEEAREGGEGEMARKCREEIVVVGCLFAKAVEGRVDLKTELRPLLDVDEGIGELFGWEG